MSKLTMSFPLPLPGSTLFPAGLGNFTLLDPSVSAIFSTAIRGQAMWVARMAILALFSGTVWNKEVSSSLRRRLQCIEVNRRKARNLANIVLRHILLI